jgi:hypothetical protein
MRAMTVPVSLKADLAAVFERYAAETGDVALRRVVVELRRPPPRKGGRKFIDDDAAIVEMESHIADGMSIRRAAKYVAVGLTGQSTESTERRLIEKHRDKHRDSPT